jgi:hypothetical protein
MPVLRIGSAAVDRHEFSFIDPLLIVEFHVIVILSEKSIVT